MRLLELHNLILAICKDKYAVPEMMAERITKEVNDYVAKTAELTRKEIWEWGNGDCPHRIMADEKGKPDISLRIRRQCWECWEALKGS